MREDLLEPVEALPDEVPVKLDPVLLELGAHAQVAHVQQVVDAQVGDGLLRAVGDQLPQEVETSQI